MNSLPLTSTEIDITLDRLGFRHVQGLPRGFPQVLFLSLGSEVATNKMVGTNAGYKEPATKEKKPTANNADTGGKFKCNPKTRISKGSS